METIKKFINKITSEDLEKLVEDYFSIMDGIYHEGNISEPTKEEIQRKENLKEIYGNIYN